MDVTLFGMMIVFRGVPEKALAPMLVTLLGMVMAVRAVPTKAESPMLMTLLGMVTETSREQPEKALAPMEITPVPDGNRGKVRAAGEGTGGDAGDRIRQDQCAAIAEGAEDHRGQDFVVKHPADAGIV